MKKLLFLLLILASNFLIGQSSNSLTQADKIFGLSKFWQEVNYNFVFYDTLNQEAWEEAYRKSIDEALKSTSDYEYYRVLQKLCSFLKDGHTNIFFPEAIQKALSGTNFGEYKFYLSNIEGKAIITRVNLSKKDELPIGTEIVKLNGLKTADYVNKHVRPYMGTSPVYIENNASIRNLLQSPIGTQFELEIKRPDGSLGTLQITREKNSEKAVYPERKPFTLFEFKWLNNEIAYVALNSFSDAGIVDEFKKKLPDLYRAKSLIIDLRNNTGGSNLNAKQIFKYLTYDSVLYGARSSTRQHNATYKAWGSYIKPEDTIHGKKEWGIDKTEAKKYFNYRRNLGKHYFEYQGDTITMDEKRIVIPTMVLIGNRTASAAEDFLILSHKQEHMTTIGEPTFGSTGQPVFGDLPGGGRYRICTKKDTYPNGKEFVGYGIQPQIKVTKKLIDFIENNDVVLDMALQHLTK